MRCTECEALREKINELQDKCRAMEKQKAEKDAELCETRQALAKVTELKNTGLEVISANMIEIATREEALE
jgi:hypothetical protein